MKTNLICNLLLVISLAIMLSSCGTQQVEVESDGVDSVPTTESTETPVEPSPTVYSQPVPSQTATATIPAAQRYTFDELGISLQVPADLYVQKDPSVSLNDNSKLEGYLFYIQNYGYPGGPSSGDFQMYGSLQHDLPHVSWEEFADIQNNSENYEYVSPIAIDGLRGFETQYAGQRPNYVYLFHIDGHVLRIAVSSPTPENKALAEEILNTLEFTSAGFSDVSHVQLITEPNLLYQLFIPEGWSYEFNPTAGIQLSEMEASSPDAVVEVDDAEGPHTNINYKDGVFMSLVVLEDDSAIHEPNMAVIEREYNYYLSGFEVTEYVFAEPSTAKGEIREVRVYHNGNSYLLRFG